MSHVTHTNESCHADMNISCHARTDESCHEHINELCHEHVNKSCHAYECFKSQTQMSHVRHLDESSHAHV